MHWSVTSMQHSNNYNNNIDNGKKLRKLAGFRWQWKMIHEFNQFSGHIDFQNCYLAEKLTLEIIL